MIYQRHTQKGFTLIEVMVALAIFAILCVIAMGGLHNILKNRDILQGRLARLSDLQMTSVLMQRDLQQMIDRPVNTPFGAADPGFQAAPNSITFTRDGYTNPLGIQQRSTLQRVSYQLMASKLVRMTWPVLDQAPSTKSLSRVLVSHVTGLEFQYVDNHGKIYPTWPPVSNTTSTKSHPIKWPEYPNGIIVTMTITNWGKVQWVIPVQAWSLKIQQQGDENAPNG